MKLDPVTRDYAKARAALPKEQREVWGAPVRDGTCADDSDDCEACRCAPPLPAEDQAAIDALWADSLDARDPTAWDDDEFAWARYAALARGGSDEATMAAGEIVGWVVGITFILAAVVVALRSWGVL